jgi:hypothetical protein
MDHLFERGVPDPHYLRRRGAALIIGVDPKKVTRRSFCADMEALISGIKHRKQEEIELAAGMLVRAYDPSTSCFTHCISL